MTRNTIVLPSLRMKIILTFLKLETKNRSDKIIKWQKKITHKVDAGGGGETLFVGCLIRLVKLDFIKKNNN